MRLLSRKIYRAFPELDQFDDAVCKQYVQRARQSKGASWGRFFVFVSIPASFFGWIAFLNLVTSLPYDSLGGPDVYMMGARIKLIQLIEILAEISVVWIPFLAAFLVRDYFLNRCLQRRVLGSRCPECAYTLIGLQVEDFRYGRGVKCPECGHKLYFNISHLTEADINPALLVDS
ncbi:MAG: hypothetical protein JKY96_07860 [Phycisphaerales bacterium]|nr:hypothetical protein [Phycisphaerales bacterium]